MTFKSRYPRAYWKIRSDNYEQVKWVRNPKLLDTLTEFIPEHTHSILDLGMGTGALAYHLDDQVETIYGMDLSRAMMEKAPKEISKIQGNLLNIPIFDSSIPCVVLRNVIHYIEDKQSAVREVFRILEPEGTLIFSQVVPFDEEISPEYDWLIGRQLHYPTVSELKHLLQSFRIETEKEVVISAQSILNWLNHTTQTETEKLETLERHRQTSNHYKQLVNYYEKDNDIFVDIKHICLKLRKPG